MPTEDEVHEDYTVIYGPAAEKRWEGESTGGGSETKTCRLFEGDATKV